LPSPFKISSLSLSDALAKHGLDKNVSFHTPGHKGFAWQSDYSFSLEASLKKDLSESVPGLDELAYPNGIIQNLEQRAAQLWGAQSTLISVNGATAGIIAAILMLSKHGTHLLVPRNCHRSVIHALILSGLEPVWFEPRWENEWNLWGAPDVSKISEALKNFSEQNSTDSTKKLAGIIVTSPTYAGALANIKAISALCDIYKIPLVVDEAHGAHLNWTEHHSKAALQNGASIVIHSLHKNLSCPTQTGLVHISKKGTTHYGFSEFDLRSCLNLIQSSSPSYLFMNSIDTLVIALSNGKAQTQIKKLEELAKDLKTFFSEMSVIDLYQSTSGSTATHFLIKNQLYDSQKLQNLLVAKGIFPESFLGKGLLFLLGIGSQASDIEIFKSALEDIFSSAPPGNGASTNKTDWVIPQKIEQKLSPKVAFNMPSHLVSQAEAVGKISAECLAPCPPGWPILVPGQLITEEILNFKNIKSVRIIKTNGHFSNV
jgi:arginine decarboxylase